VCLSIPSKVTSIDKATNTATVDTMGVQRQASLDLIQDEVNIGDYVLLHIGFVMEKISEELALDSIELYKEIIDKLDDEEKEQAILESESCENKT